MTNKNNEIVRKLIKHIQNIQTYCKGKTYEDFTTNSQLAEACVFNLSQMGELTNRIDEDFATLHPTVPWDKIYGLRNRIVHDYEGINLKMIWSIIERDLDGLLQTLLKIL
ncbi:MAG: DUF86 domain-containing protein [Planctomycetaceae bacterium]|jgi:uncharacterized protein with HEPN domain|nr:DUF86 domain-containing protein [Planctomycetaceae bacterium]